MTTQRCPLTGHLLAAWLVLAWPGYVPAASEDDGFPYEAYVSVEQADVLAGPGHRFYVTCRLPRGTRVEIYREEPSGWLAIRPPEGSFSWVPADFVERHPTRPSVGRVRAPVGAWVGTSVERVAQHRQQVTLQKGELVHILGDKEVRGPDGTPQRWLKIAPPAGEFRWIFLRDVAREPPDSGEASPGKSLASDRDSTDSPRDDQAPDPPQHSSPAERRSERVEHRSESGSAVRLSSAEIPLHDLHEDPRLHPNAVVPAQFASSSRGASPDGFVPRRRPAGDTNASPTAGEPPRAESFPPRSPRREPQRLAAAVPPSTPLLGEGSTARQASALTSGTTLSAQEIARRLEELEVDLALMLAQDRSRWNLAALREQAMLLVERGADPAWRGRARLLVDRIEQLAEAFQEALPPRSIGAVTHGPEGFLTAAASRPGEEVRYDAQGWLKEVVSRQASRPPAPYAVVDAQGQPLCFVSPAPGLNLHRYLNRQVGLFGRRGWLAELQKPHLLVERVVELDR